jgi:hypothetical protein
VDAGYGYDEVTMWKLKFGCNVYSFFTQYPTMQCIAYLNMKNESRKDV